MEPPPGSPDEQLLSVGEVAALLRVTPRTVRRYIAEGDLPASRLRADGPYRIAAGDVRALLLRGQVP